MVIHDMGHHGAAATIFKYVYIISYTLLSFFVGGGGGGEGGRRREEGRERETVLIGERSEFTTYSCR